MISIQIEDTKQFMAQLLSKDTFDSFYMVESTIRMGITYHIDGHLNKDFYDTATKEQLTRDYCTWKEIRAKIFDMIKGKQLPLQIKVILKAPKALELPLLEHSGVSFSAEELEGLYLNIFYEQATLKLTTGISVKTFSMDKTLERSFDDYIRQFLQKYLLG